MGVVVDDLMGVMSHSHSDVPSTGGFTMTGDLEFPDTGFIMKASDSSRWRVTVGTDGTLSTSAIIETGLTGQPMGLLLALTYA